MKSNDAPDEFAVPEECRDIFAALDSRLKRIEDALFHPDHGFHSIAQKVTTHIDVLCTVATYTARAAKLLTAAVVGLAALVVAAKTLGVG